MKKVNRVMLLSIVSGGVICLLAIGMMFDNLAFFGQSYLAQTPPSALRQVQNMAEHIKIVSAEILNTGGKSDLQLKLLNLMPDKKLTAVVITGADPHNWLELDIAYSDLPEHQVGPNRELVVTVENVKEGQLTFVRSAIFEGPIIEGDLRPALNIINKRIGEKLALTYFLKEMTTWEKTLNSHSLSSQLSSLKTMVEGFPEIGKAEALARQEMIVLNSNQTKKISTLVDAETLAMQINIGIQYGKERVLHRINGLDGETEVEKLREKTGRMRSQWEKLTSRLWPQSK